VPENPPAKGMAGGDPGYRELVQVDGARNREPGPLVGGLPRDDGAPDQTSTASRGDQAAGPNGAIGERAASYGSRALTSTRR